VECLFSKGNILALALVTEGLSLVTCNFLLELGFVGGKYEGSACSEVGVSRTCRENSGLSGAGTGGLQFPVGASWSKGIGLATNPASPSLTFYLGVFLPDLTACLCLLLGFHIVQ
jgi:Na+-translocating ferredoxin:NAD+ oxidoreductase RnfA subunit